MRHLGFLINLHVPRRGDLGEWDRNGVYEQENEQKWSSNFSQLMKLLPSLTTEQGPKLEIDISFDIWDNDPMIPDILEAVVQQAMRCLGPLRGTKNLEIHCSSLSEGFQGAVGEIRDEWTRKESRGEESESKQVDL